MPSGFIMQWGRADGISRGEQRVVTFPIPFPSAVLNLSATVNRSGGGPGTQNMYAQTSSNSQCIITHDADDSGGADNAFWQAYGY